jgi:hypothetical protein
MPALALRARRTGSVEDLGSADQRTPEVRGRVGSTVEVLRVLGRDREEDDQKASTGTMVLSGSSKKY